MTHAFEEYEPTKYQFRHNDGFERLGVKYRWKSTDAREHVLERQDNKLLERFSHFQIKKLLEDKHAPLVFHRNAYGGGDEVTSNAVRDFVRELTPAEQEMTLVKEDYCKRFLEKERATRHLTNKRGGKRNRVTRSDESMSATIDEIEGDMRAQNKAIKEAREGSEKKKDYRKSAEEAREAVIIVPSPRTLRRWLNAYETTGDRMQLVASNGTSRVGTYYDVEEAVFLETYVRQYVSEDRLPIVELHEKMAFAIEDANALRTEAGLKRLRIPSLKTFQKRVAALPPALKDIAHLGEDRARAIHRAVNQGLSDVLRPLERVEMDEWKIDLQTLLAISGVWQKMSAKQQKTVPRVRLWLTAVIDVATRCLIGFRVHREAPSVLTAISTLELSTFDKTDFAKSFGCLTPWYMHGHIEAAVFDSATWFTSQAFRVTLSDLGTQIFFPPAGAASARGTMERFFRTASTQALRYMSGRTWGSLDEKGDTDAQAEASVCFDELVKLLYRFFIDVYHNTPHDGLGEETPREAWDRLTRVHRVGPPVQGNVRRHIFGVNVRRKISKSGILFMGIRYQSEAIQHHRRGKRKPEVLVRVSRHDIGSISVWFGKGWVNVPAVYDEFQGMSLYAWSVACNALRAENKEKARMSRKTVRKTNDYLQENAQVARLEAGLGTGCITDVDIEHWEKGVKFEVGAATGEAIPEDFAKDLVVDPQFYLDMGITVSAEAADYVVDPRDTPEPSESAPEKAKGQARGTQASKKFNK